MTKRVIKQIGNAVTTILLVVMMVLAALLWGVRLLGMEVYVVQSGSMEPEYPVGSVVYVKEVDTEELQVGDVITFELNGDTKGTHRIIELVPDENDSGTVRYRTKGDANEHEDHNLVETHQIVGKVVFGLPLLGYLIAYIRQPGGIYLVVAVAAVILLVMLLPDILYGEDKKKEEISE